ncbi:MAG TPA: S9 family peptidase, partial [Candidatus Didemnitutus sp.]|nr:S9 family peptidase [Candidatus Didemnitutus sp.]
SPDGSHILFEKEMNGQFVLATLDFKTGKPALSTPARHQYIHDSCWVGPDQIMFQIVEDFKYETSAANPGEASMLTKTVVQHIDAGYWLVDANLTRIVRVPSFERPLVVSDIYPRDPARVLFVEQSIDRFYSPLYAYDPIHNKTKVLEQNPGNILGWQTDAAGKVRLATCAGPNGSQFLQYRATEESPWQRLAFSLNADAVTFDPTGRYVLLSFRNPAGRLVLQSFDLTAQKLVDEPLSDPVYDLLPNTVIRDNRTGSTRGLIYDEEKPAFIWLDPAYKEIHGKLAATFPDSIVYPLGAASTGELLIRMSSDVSPPQYFLLDAEHGKLRTFLDPQPRVRGLTLSPMKPITFKAADGTELHGYLTLPAGRTGTKPPPLVVISHGGPATRDTWAYDPEVQYLAALGYAVLQVNYRGSSGYGQELRDIIEVGHQSVDDVADGIKWATAQGMGDAKRVVAYGGSYGGYISLALATRYPDLVCGAIGFAGVYDWEYQMRKDSDKLREIVTWRSDYWPPVKTNADRYRAISPALEAAKAKAPVLLIHGQDDQRVDFAQSDLMAKALRKAGKTVEIFRDTTGEHGLRDEKLRKLFYERITSFLFQYAPPDAMP